MRNHHLPSAPIIGILLVARIDVGANQSSLLLGNGLTLVQAVGGALILVAVIMVLHWQRADVTTASAAPTTGL